MKVTIPMPKPINGRAKTWIDVESQIVTCLMLILGLSGATIMILALQAQEIPSELFALTGSVMTGLVAILKGGSEPPPAPAPAPAPPVNEEVRSPTQ